MSVVLGCDGKATFLHQVRGALLRKEFSEQTFGMSGAGVRCSLLFCDLEVMYTLRPRPRL